MYLGDYQKAINDFNQSSGVMHINKQLIPRQHGEDTSNEAPDAENQSHASSQTDLSDVGLCSLNIHEFSFNCLICMLHLKQYKEALKKADYMLDTVPKKYRPQLYIVRS